MKSHVDHERRLGISPVSSTRMNCCSDSRLLISVKFMRRLESLAIISNIVFLNMAFMRLLRMRYSTTIMHILTSWVLQLLAAVEVQLSVQHLVPYGSYVEHARPLSRWLSPEHLRGQIDSSCRVTTVYRVSQLHLRKFRVVGREA